MNYLEVEFKLTPFKPWNEVFVAYLSEIDFESFQEETPVLRAYISENQYDNSRFERLISELKLNQDLNFS
jgi:hypothetical protein